MCKTVKFVGQFLFLISVGVLAETPISSGAPGNPGIKIRFTKRFVDYIVQVVGRATDTVIPQTKITQLDRDFVGIPTGHLTILNLHITDYKKAESYSAELIAPNVIKLSVRNLSLTAAFSYSSWILVLISRVSQTGTGTATIIQFSADVLITLSQTGDGKIQLLLTSCDNNIRAFDLTLNPTGDAAVVVLALKSAIEANARELLRVQICQRIAHVINLDLSIELQKLTDLVPLARNGSFTAANSDSVQVVEPLTDDPREKAAAKDLHALLLAVGSNLTLDTRFSKPPTIDSLAIQTYHKGEISWNGAGDTPFFPNDFLPIDESSGKMIYFKVSDYVLNSMINALYKHDALMIKANDKDTPSLKESLRTKCKSTSDDLCIGNALPGLGKKYSNHRIELELTPVSAPYLVIDGNTVKQTFEGILTMYVISLQATDTARTNVLSAHVNIAYSAHFQTAGDRIVSKINFTNSNVKVDTTTLDVDTKNTFETLAGFAVDLIQERASGLMKRGVTLPDLKFAKFIAPVLTIGTDKSFSVGTDIEIDEAKFIPEAYKRSQTELKKIEANAVVNPVIIPG